MDCIGSILNRIHCLRQDTGYGWNEIQDMVDMLGVLMKTKHEQLIETKVVMLEFLIDNTYFELPFFFKEP